MKTSIFRTFMVIAIGAITFSFGANLYAQAPKNLTDAEWQLMIDRINLLVDNHFENRDYDAGQKANWNITGLSVGVYHNGRTAFFSRGYHESEQRNVRKRTPVTENSIFAIGSLSKPVSLIVSSYFSRINNPATGRPYINLNDPVNNYFPTRPYIDTNGTAVHPTLLQFATHYGGTPREIGTGFPTLDQFRAQLANLTYTSKPGTAYNYSSGATVVANIVASLYYKDFPQRGIKDLLSEHLFRPLGMNSTMVYGWTNQAMLDRMTLPHRFNGAPTNLESVPNRVHLGGASGSISSTAVDMMRLVAFILGDDVPRGTEILQQAAAAGIGWRTTNRTVPSSAFTPYASNASKLGVRFRELFTRPANAGQRYGITFEHGGGLGGHYTSMEICPDTKTAVIVLVNTEAGRGTLYAQIMDNVLNATYSGQRTPFNDFDNLVASYSGATANVDIVLNESSTITGAMENIGVPARAGATLTIRSANPARPVTLTRGATGDLFTVPAGATLIFRDIIIDGGSGGAFAKSSGGTLVRVNGGSFIMNAGTVLRNNVNMAATGSNTDAVNGGGVVVSGTGVFTMNGGEISGNISGFEAGGVYVDQNTTFNMTGGKINGNTANNTGGVYARRSTFTMSGGQISGNTATTAAGGVRVIGETGTFTMTGGEISGNTAGTNGGGVLVASSGTFTMSGGVISGNTAGGNGNGVRSDNGTFNLNSGVVAGNGAAITNVISGTYNLNTASPKNGVTIAWDRPAGTLNYTVGSSTNLTVSPNTATAVWQNQGGVLGISYANGSNTGWIKQW